MSIEVALGFSRLVRVMEELRDVLDRADAASIELRNSLYAKDWESLGTSMGELEGLSRRIEELEALRVASLEVFLDGRDPGVSLDGLSDSERSMFLVLKSDLKCRMVKVQSRSRGIEAYASSRASLSKEILRELVPSKRGGTYDKSGRSSGEREEPVVLSKEL